MKKVIKVSQTAENTIKSVCKLSLEADFRDLSKVNISKIEYQSLSAEEIGQLSRKIDILPSEYRNILFFRYCFNNTPSETDKILDIEDSIGKLRYIQKMLSRIMELENAWIDENSMTEACRLALAEYTKDYNEVKMMYNPNYSINFKRKLKGIKIKQNLNSIAMSVAKRVAVFILVCFLSLSAVLTVNAEAREKVFDWVVQRFPKFSIFIPQGMDEVDDSTELTSLKINYIPTGFELENTHEGRSMLIYDYWTEDNQNLTIKLVTLSSEGRSYYDTEGIEIEEIIFKDSKGYIWEADGIAYLIWYQDGVECHIVGNLSREEISKIGESISK